MGWGIGICWKCPHLLSQAHSSVAPSHAAAQAWPQGSFLSWNLPHHLISSAVAALCWHWGFYSRWAWSWSSPTALPCIWFKGNIPVIDQKFWILTTTWLSLLCSVFWHRDCKNGEAIWDDSVAVSQNVKRIISMWHRGFFTRDRPGKRETIGPWENLHVNVGSSIIYNIPKMEMIPMCVNCEWINKMC